jgi:CheY-like chemotaxis protein
MGCNTSRKKKIPDKIYKIDHIHHITHITRAQKEDVINDIIEANHIINKEITIGNEIKLTNIINLKINKINNIKILYVEDIEVYFRLMEFILEKFFSKLNIKLFWAKNIKDSLEILDNHTFDLIFLDRQLEENDLGDDLIYLLKNNNFNMNKIIIISALDDLNEIGEFLEMGVHYYIKPLKINMFVETLKKIFIIPLSYEDDIIIKNSNSLNNL